MGTWPQLITPSSPQDAGSYDGASFIPLWALATAGRRSEPLASAQGIIALQSCEA